MKHLHFVKKKHLTTHPACIRIAHGKAKILYRQVRYGEDSQTVYVI